MNDSVPRKKLEAHTRKLAQTLLSKNQTVLRGIKIAMKRVQYMDWEVSADYLYAKMGEALNFGSGEESSESDEGVPRRQEVQAGPRALQRDDLRRGRNARGVWGERWARLGLEAPPAPLES